MKFVEDGESRVEIHYILHLNRRPIYYITVIVAPTFLISALSILGIFSPGQNDGPRGEKVLSLYKFILCYIIWCLGLVGARIAACNDCFARHRSRSYAEEQLHPSPRL